MRLEWLDDKWPIWAAVVLKWWYRTIRTKVSGFDRFMEYGRGVIAIWHEDDLSLLVRFGYIGCCLMVSQSRDGEYIAKAVEYFGTRTVRGSSTRGAVGGLVSLIKEVRKGAVGAMVIDGPQGPRRKCKQGVVRLSQKTKTPIIPFSIASSRKWVFKKTWHQAYLPAPFSRQFVVVGEPLELPDTTSDEDMEKHCRTVEDALNRTEAAAKRALENWIWWDELA